MTALSGLWVGEELPKSARLCIKSHLDHGFGFRLFVYPHLWHDNVHVPAGCTVEDATEILGKELIYKQKTFNSYGPFVDWWRYVFQYRIGEPIIDLDMICMRPWELKHWAYYTADHRQVMIGWLNFPAGTQLLADIINSFHFPNCLYVQADWIKKSQARWYKGDSYKSLKEQLRNKWYGWGGSDWLVHGVRHYRLHRHIGEMLWTKYFPPDDWQQLFDGTISPDDPRLGELNELHLHGHRVFNYGNSEVLDTSPPHSVFMHLWNKHFN